jgi:hypothetical protein
MKEAWKNISPGECSHQKCKHKQQKQKEKNELCKMIMKEVQETVQSILKQLHKHHCSDDDQYG